MEPLRIFIGYDPREIVAYHVLCHSIISRSSIPVSITPLVQKQLRRAGLYHRPPDAASTEFSLTRFLVPYLAGYRGVAIYMDCDFLCLDDIANLAYEAYSSRAHSNKAVHVVKHFYEPTTLTKMDGQKQENYPRKNWSSLMVFNSERCIALSLSAVNTGSPSWLHRFEWMPDEQIGNLSLEWNYLVGEYPHMDPPPRMLHYTLGGPWMEHECREFDNLWWREYRSSLALPAR